jgi:hypothetical protein
MSALVSLDRYTFAVLLIAVLILGVCLGMVWSPWFEARNQRRVALKRLRDNWNRGR